jgi:hypothetical protein
MDKNSFRIAKLQERLAVVSLRQKHYELHYAQMSPKLEAEASQYIGIINQLREVV